MTYDAIIERVFKDCLSEIEVDMVSYAWIFGLISYYGDVPTVERHDIAVGVVDRMLERDINIGFFGGKPGEPLTIEAWGGTVSEKVQLLRSLIPKFSNPPLPDETPWLERTWNLKQ